MLSDIYSEFVKMHVLHHAALEPVCGLALVAELRRHGYRIGPGVERLSSGSSLRPPYSANGSIKAAVVPWPDRLVMFRVPPCASAIR